MCLLKRINCSVVGIGWNKCCHWSLENPIFYFISSCQLWWSCLWVLSLVAAQLPFCHLEMNCEEKWFTVSSFSNNFMDMHFILGNCTNPQPLRLWMYVLQLCLYQLLWFRLPDYITFCFFAFWRAFAFISEPKCCHVQFGIFLSKFDRMIGWCLKMYL